MSRTAGILARAFALVIALTAVGVATGANAQSLTTRAPRDYQSNGASIAGWNWLRSSGDYAEWTWTAVPTTAGDACLNLSFLVTNGANGGAGYSATIHIQIISSSGRVRTTSVRLANPFRPTVPTNTNGVGYPAYGAVCSQDILSLLAPGTKLRIEWTPAAGMHVAVRRDGVLLAYAR